MTRLGPAGTTCFVVVFLSGGSVSATAQDAPAGHVIYFVPSDEVRVLVDEALARNPAIREAHARARAFDARPVQAGALPDPMLTYTQFLRSAETRVGPQLNSVMVTQSFPWLGIRERRERAARHEATAAGELAGARERDVVAGVKRAFHELAYVDEALSITERERLLLEHYQRLADARYASGQGLQQAVLRLHAEITRVQSRHELLVQQRRSAEARVNTWLDRPAEQPLPRATQPALPTFPLDLERLYELGVQHRPELKAATAGIDRAAVDLELSRLASRPLFTVGAGFVNVGGRSDPAGRQMPPPDNGKNAVTASLGVTVPLWREKYRAGVRQATEQATAQRAAYESLANDMRFAVRDAVNRLDTLERQIELFERALVPQAETALRSTEAAYETGQAGVLDLLDTERTLLDIRLAEARYQADYWIALAELERAIGTAFPTP